MGDVSSPTAHSVGEGSPYRCLAARAMMLRDSSACLRRDSLCEVLCNRPDEPCQFSGDCDNRYLGEFIPTDQPPVLVMQPCLRLLGKAHDFRRTPLPPFRQSPAHHVSMPVTPCRLHEDTSQVGVACLGDAIVGNIVK